MREQQAGSAIPLTAIDLDEPNREPAHDPAREPEREPIVAHASQSALKPVLKPEHKPGHEPDYEPLSLAGHESAEDSHIVGLIYFDGLRSRPFN